MVGDPSRPSLASHFLLVGTLFLAGIRERESKEMKERMKECKPVDATERGISVCIALAQPDIFSRFHAIMNFFILIMNSY